LGWLGLFSIEAIKNKIDAPFLLASYICHVPPPHLFFLLKLPQCFKQAPTLCKFLFVFWFPSSLFCKLPSLLLSPLKKRKNIPFFFFFLLFDFVLGVSYRRRRKTCCQEDFFF
jgi:hypothetical protein